MIKKLWAMHHPMAMQALWNRVCIWLITGNDFKLFFVTVKLYFLVVCYTLNNGASFHIYQMSQERGFREVFMVLVKLNQQKNSPKILKLKELLLLLWRTLQDERDCTIEINTWKHITRITISQFTCVWHYVFSSPINFHKHSGIFYKN